MRVAVDGRSVKRGSKTWDIYNQTSKTETRYVSQRRTANRVQLFYTCRRLLFCELYLTRTTQALQISFSFPLRSEAKNLTKLGYNLYDTRSNCQTILTMTDPRSFSSFSPYHRLLFFFNVKYTSFNQTRAKLTRKEGTISNVTLYR